MFTKYLQNINMNKENKMVSPIKTFACGLILHKLMCVSVSIMMKINENGIKFVSAHGPMDSWSLEFSRQKYSVVAPFSSRSSNPRNGTGSYFAGGSYHQLGCQEAPMYIDKMPIKLDDDFSNYNNLTSYHDHLFYNPGPVFDLNPYRKFGGLQVTFQPKSVSFLQSHNNEG